MGYFIRWFQRQKKIMSIYTITEWRCTMKKHFITLTALAVILIFGSYGFAAGADYPAKSITIICPYSPGGSLDGVSRAFAAVAEKHLGQPVVVLNKPGGRGMIGEIGGVRANPDGYTLTTRATSSVSTMEWEKINKRDPGYRLDEFASLGAVTLDPTLVVVPYDSPWNTMDDLIKAIKAKPDFYAIGSGSFGTWVPGAYLMKILGIKCRHVPYKGGGPMLTALVGGHIDWSGQWPSTSIPLARGKKLKILAVQGSRRLKAIPDVPTLKELGVQGAEWEQWIGYSVPKQTPQEIIDKLGDAVEKVAKDESFIKTIETAGTEVIFMDGPSMTKRISQEEERFAKIFNELIEAGYLKKD